MNENMENSDFLGQDEEIAEQEGVVAPSEEGGEETGLLGEGVSADSDRSDAEREEQPQTQTHEENAAARAARLRAEAETQQRMARQYDERIATMGMVDPYTKRPITNWEELQAYGSQYQRDKLAERAKQAGRTVEEQREEEENRAFLAKKRKEEAEQQKTSVDREKQTEFLAQDLKEFQRRYPNVDVVKLEQNPKFQKFAGKRLYREPLGDLYADFADLMGDAVATARARVESLEERGTGGGDGETTVKLTTKQAASLAAWNKANPDMKMTPKEFLGTD